MVASFFYFSNRLLSFDEFHHLYESSLISPSKPFANFTPGKTIFGYYLNKIPFFFFKDQWQIIQLVRANNILLISILFLVFIFNLKHKFSYLTLLALSILLLSNTFILKYSHEIRPDMIAGFFAAIGVSFLFRNKNIWASIFLFIAFAFTQKTAVIILPAILSRPFYSKKSFFSLLLSFSTAIILYVLYFILFSSKSIEEILYVTFLQKHFFTAALTNSYNNLVKFWIEYFNQNPLFLAMPLIALINMMIKANVKKVESKSTLFFFLFFILLLVLYPQPWPFFICLITPTLSILAAIGIEQTVSKNSLILIKNSKVQACLFIIFAAIIPFQSINKMNFINFDYQREVAQTAKDVLQNENSKYLAGFNFLINKNQSPKDFYWLDLAELKELKKNKIKIKKNLDSLRNSPPLLVINNYRINFLPLEIQKFLQNNYLLLRNNILTLKLSSQSNINAFTIPEKGLYRVITNSTSTNSIKNEQKIYLNEETKLYASDGTLTLQLMPRFAIKTTSSTKIFSDENYLF